MRKKIEITLPDGHTVIAFNSELEDCPLSIETANDKIEFSKDELHDVMAALKIIAEFAQ